MICITIQRTLSVAKVRYLIGDKECFKIFYPRFFAWINLFLLTILFSILCYFHFNPFKHMWQGFLFFECSVWLAYSHPFAASFTRIICTTPMPRHRPERPALQEMVACLPRNISESGTIRAWESELHGM